MKIDLDGSFDVAASPSDAYLFLTDPTKFAPLLPMFKELKDQTADDFRIVMDVGVPQIRGTAEAQVKFVDRVINQRASFVASVRHSLGMADSKMAFDLLQLDGGTRVEWDCATMVRGTLASVAAGILSPLAKRNVAAMIESVRNELGPLETESAVDEAATASESNSAAAPSRWERIKQSVGKSGTSKA